MTNTIMMRTKVFCKNKMPNRDLMMLKLLLFTYFGATHTLVPYLAIHMKQLGISVQETAIIHALLPLAMFVGPPISGFVADKFGGYKILMIAALMTTGAFHTALLWVPQMGPGPSYTDATISCSPDGDSSINLTYSAPLEQCARNEPATAHFRHCRRHCLRNFAYNVAGLRPDNGSVVPCQWSDDGSNACLWVHSTDVQNGSVGRLSFLVRRTSPSTAQNISSLNNKGAAGSITDSHDDIYVSFQPAVNATDKCPTLLDDAANCVLMCSIEPNDWRHLPTVYCGDQTLTFWLYVALRVMGTIFMSACYVLLDAITLFLVAKGGTDYGKQRIWPVLATAVFPPIAGVLVDYYSGLNNGVTDYSPTFYVMDVLLVATAFMAVFLNVDISLSSNTNLKTVGQLLKNPRADWLFVALFVLGTLWGFVEVFLYWFLIDLGSPKYLLGLTMTVGSAVGIPVLFFSDRIIKWIGHVYLVFLAFVFYCIRYIGLSFIVNPFWCLAFEAMEIFTLHLLWVSVVTYSVKLAPKSLLATMQGAIGGMHYGVGRGSGSLVGGLLMGFFGARDAFRFMGIAAAVAGVIFLSVERIFFWTPLVPAVEHNMAEVSNNNIQDDDVRKRKYASEDPENKEKTKL